MMIEFLSKYFPVYLYGIVAVIFLVCMCIHLSDIQYKQGANIGWLGGYAKGLHEGLNTVSPARSEHWDHALTDEEMRFVTLTLKEQLEAWNKARGVHVENITQPKIVVDDNGVLVIDGGQRLFLNGEPVEK